MVHYGALKRGRAVPIELTKRGGGPWQIFGPAHTGAFHTTSGGMVVVVVMEGGGRGDE